MTRETPARVTFDQGADNTGAIERLTSSPNQQAPMAISPDLDSGRWQISATVGYKPEWSHDGRELFYATDSALMSVGVQTTGSQFSTGNAVKLFDILAYFFGNAGRSVVVEHWTRRTPAAPTVASAS